MSPPKRYFWKSGPILLVGIALLFSAITSLAETKTTLTLNAGKNFLRLQLPDGSSWQQQCLYHPFGCARVWEGKNQDAFDVRILNTNLPQVQFKTYCQSLFDQLRSLDKNTQGLSPLKTSADLQMCSWKTLDTQAFAVWKSGVISLVTFSSKMNSQINLGKQVAKIYEKSSVR